MAVPKRKTGRARGKHRKAQWKGSLPTYATCPQCHQPRLPHRVCSKCGYYRGRQAVEVE